MSECVEWPGSYKAGESWKFRKSSHKYDAYGRTFIFIFYTEWKQFLKGLFKKIQKSRKKTVL